MSEVDNRINNRCDSFDFNEIVDRSRSATIDDELISSGPDSRSGSISENESSSTSQYCRSIVIPVPDKRPKTRKRDINYDGSSAHDIKILTPTPSKYCKMMIENYECLQEFISHKK